MLKISLMDPKWGAASYPIIIIHPDFATNFDFPALAKLTDGKRIQPTWVFRGEHPDINVRQMALKSQVKLKPQVKTIWPKNVRTNQVYAGMRVFEFFDLDCLELELILPPYMKLRLHQAPLDRLPNSLSVEVSSDVYKSFARPGRRVAWAVATHNSLAIPVRLIRSSETKDADAWCNGFFTTVLFANDSETVQFSHPRYVIRDRATKAIRKLPLKKYFRKHEKTAIIAATFISGVRLIVDILEFFLRSYFKAPKRAFLTTMAYMGDEFPRLVRLHPAAFTMIGIKPGDEVIVEWCGRRTSAIADELVHLESQTQKSEFISEHLYISVSGQVRVDLGITVSTAVEIRRKVMPKVLDNLNSVFLPVISVVVGGNSLKLPGVTVFLLAFFAALLSLGKVRLPRAAPGELPLW